MSVTDLKKDYIAKYLLKKTIIILILLPIFLHTKANTKHSVIINQQQTLQNNSSISTKYDHSNNQYLQILSNTIEIYYPKKIQFSGNVHCIQGYHNLKSDTLTISQKEKNNKPFLILQADGNINYHNNYIMITGNQAWINLENKNMDLHKGMYYFLHSHIHGSANTIMQRANNRYTIIKRGNFSNCIAHNNHWNIIGSKMIYDHKRNKIDIWNSYLKIKKIPIFYCPYLSLSLQQNNIFHFYIPNIKYSSKYGFAFKIPCPLNLPKYYYGSISPHYISNLGIKLQTKIHYFVVSNTGLILFDTIQENKKYKEKFPDYYHKKYWRIYWKNTGSVNQKWHINANYISINNSDLFEDINEKNARFFNNDCMNQKLSCNYISNNWNASLTYLGHTYSKETTKNNYYIAAPQLELNTYYKINHTSFNLKTFSQLTKFIPMHHSYPVSIRIHIEPTLNFSKHKNWGYYNAETTLNITHYQQKNIENDHMIQYENIHLKNIINRIIPKIKISSKIIIKKNKKSSKKYKYFFEPKLQYLYIPYHFQENIGIYDTSLVHINYNNLFYSNKYIGLDRIASANQITGSMMMRYFSKQNELFYISVGKILNFATFNKQENTAIHSHHNVTKHNYNNNNNKIISSIGCWHINNYWNFQTEIQYNTKNHKPSFNNAILEYIGKNHQILQIQYRYVNDQYIKNTITTIDPCMYYKKITQIGLITYFSLFNSWQVSYSYYHNIVTKRFIDQTINIQYTTPCWHISSSIERKLVNHHYGNNIYDNKIRLNIKLQKARQQLKLDSCNNILNIGMLSYQPIF